MRASIAANSGRSNSMRRIALAAAFAVSSLFAAAQPLPPLADTSGPAPVGFNIAAPSRPGAEGGCEVAITLRNDRPESLTSLLTRVEIFNGLRRSVRDATWQHVNAGEEQHYAIRLRRPCAPSMRVVFREVVICHLQNRFVSDCADDMKALDFKAGRGVRKLPVQFNFPGMPLRGDGVPDTDRPGVGQAN
jgi:hypothetical protein